MPLVVYGLVGVYTRTHSYTLLHQSDFKKPGSPATFILKLHIKLENLLPDKTSFSTPSHPYTYFIQYHFNATS